MAAPTTITISSPKHHEHLVDGLWKRLQEEMGVDVDITWGGWSTKAHRMVLDVFLSPDKIIKTTAVGPEVVLEESASLHLLVEFLYRGQVTLTMEEVPQLLKAAKWTNFRLLVDALEKGSQSDWTNKSSAEKSNSSEEWSDSQEPERDSEFGLHVIDYLQDHDVSLQESERSSAVVNSSLLECDEVASKVAPNMSRRTKAKQDKRPTKKRQLSFRRVIKSEIDVDEDEDDTSSEVDRFGESSTVDGNQDCQEITPDSNDGGKSINDGAGVASKRRRSHVTGKRHCCNQCNFATNLRSALMSHISAIHLLEKPYECEICQRKFARIHNLRRHRRLHTNERPYKCNECEMAFFSRQSLADHKYVHLDSFTFKCDECDNLFRNATSLRYHKVKNHLPEGFIKCKMCLKVFDDKSSLEAHMLSHKKVTGGKKKHVCEICGHASKTAHSLSVHMITHKEERPFECPVCQKTFKRKFSLTIHEMTHSGEKTNVCDVCGRAFYLPNQLKNHRRVHDLNRPKKPKTFPCSNCEKSFTCSQSLVLHEKIHAGDLPHVCQVCGRGFCAKKHLDSHVKTHDKTRPFECRLCHRTFRVECNLRGHMKRLHSEGSQYSTKARPHKCPVCHWGFTHKSALYRHSRMHTGDVPYKCDYCDKQYNQRDHLTLHKSKHHPDMP